MKKFLRKILTLILIVSIITCGINAAFVKLYGADTEGIKKFSKVPESIRLCNFGSSHGLCGFNYEDIPYASECFNFGLTSQTLSYDYRIFKNYESCIGKGSTVLITISYFSLFGKPETQASDFAAKNKRYYSFLDSSLIKEYDLKTDLFIKYLPALSVRTEVLIKALLGRLRSGDPNNDAWDLVTDGKAASEDAIVACRRHIESGKYDADGSRIVDFEELDALYGLINDCKAKGVLPIIITTPYLKEYTDEVKKTQDFYNQFYSIVNKVCEDTGVEYFDYAFDERFSERYEWFMNSDHLNREGARNFVNILYDEVLR